MVSMFQFREHWNTKYDQIYGRIEGEMDQRHLHCSSHELWYLLVYEAIFLERLWYHRVNREHSSIVTLEQSMPGKSHRSLLFTYLLVFVLLDYSKQYLKYPTVVSEVPAREREREVSRAWRSIARFRPTKLRSAAVERNLLAFSKSAWARRKRLAVCSGQWAKRDTYIQWLFVRESRWALWWSSYLLCSIKRRRKRGLKVNLERGRSEMERMFVVSSFRACSTMLVFCCLVCVFLFFF